MMLVRIPVFAVLGSISLALSVLYFVGKMLEGIGKGLSVGPEYFWKRNSEAIKNWL